MASAPAKGVVRRRLPSSPAEAARLRATRRAQCGAMVRAHCRARFPSDPTGELHCVQFGKALCKQSPAATYNHLLRQQVAASGLGQADTPPAPLRPRVQFSVYCQPKARGDKTTAFLWGALAGVVLASLVKR